MELAAIINQYYDVFISKYAGSLLPGHLKAMNAIRSAVHLIPVNCMCIALIVITGNGIRSPVGTGVARSARTIRPHNGFSASR